MPFGLVRYGVAPDHPDTKVGFPCACLPFALSPQPPGPTGPAEGPSHRPTSNPALGFDSWTRIQVPRSDPRLAATP